MINKRQLIILIFLCSMSTKFQRLFSLISAASQSDGWIVLTALGIVEVAFMAIAVAFFNKFNSKMSFFAVLVNFYGITGGTHCPNNIWFFIYIQCLP